MCCSPPGVGPRLFGLSPLAVAAHLHLGASQRGACRAQEAAPGAATPDRVSAEEFVARLQPGDVVLDVRTPEEYAAGHLDGAILADVNAPDFDRKVAALDTARTTYVYCRTGNRSGRAADRMRAMGFARVVNAGGFSDLERAGAATATGE